MALAVLSIVLGVLSWLGAPLPAVVGALGLGLGVYALLRARRAPKSRRRWIQVGIAAVGILVSAPAAFLWAVLLYG